MNLLPLVTVTLFLTTFTTLNAATSEGIYKKYCASCHLKESTVNVWYKQVLIEKMQTADADERAKIQAEIRNDMSSDYVAPPFSKVKKRLSSHFDTKEEFIAFVKSYIKSPSRKKGHCKPFIYERFGVMPPVSPEMTEEEMDKIANWLYNSFKLYRAD